MTRRTLTDDERIASIREVLEAARGDWHEATSLLSVCADLNWLLTRSEGMVALHEAIGLGDEDTGLEHWHTASGGRSPGERAGVYVDRKQVHDLIDGVLKVPA